jgi:hypothetical protein
MEESYINAILVFILMTVLTLLFIDFADAYNSIVSKRIRKQRRVKRSRGKK